MQKSNAKSKADSQSYWKQWWPALIILAAVVVSFWPAFSAGFIWDDDNMLTANALIRGPLRDFWFSTRPLDYFPTTYTSLWLEWRLWGMNPMGYHVTNVILHALSCVVLWRTLVRLKLPAPWLAALLFAIHPVNVESVAWIAERKNVLAMLFYAVTAWAFVRFVQAHDRRFYIVSLSAFLLSLLSKPAAAAWPIVALGVAYWAEQASSPTPVKLRNRLKQYCAWAAPFFVVAIILSAATIAFQYGNAITSDVNTQIEAGFLTKLERVGFNVWFYLAKAIVPYPLLFAYPKWHVPTSILLALVPGALLVVLFVLLYKYRADWGKPGLVAMGYFVLLLAPVAGFFKIYFQRYSFVADHWQYFALPAITCVLAFYLRRARLHYIVGIGLVLLLASLTFARCRVFHDNETIWQDTLAKDSTCCMALDQLGFNREQAGQIEEAISFYQRSVALDPTDALTRVNLGYCLALTGKVDEGIAELRETIQRAPNSAYAYYELGLILRQQGKTDEAVTQFRQAIQHNATFTPSYNELAKCLWQLNKRDEAVAQVRHIIDIEPDNVEALVGLGAFLKDEGKPGEGLPFLQKAAALQPETAVTHSGLANALWSLNQTNAAQEQFTVALHLDPNDLAALYGMANCLRLSGKTDDAASYYERVLARNPQHAESHFQLAMIRAAQNQKDVALTHFRAAARLMPNWPEAVNNFAWFLATNPKSTAAESAQAVRLAQHAVDLSGGKNAVALDTLGVAWARNEVFAQATNAARAALQLAMQAGQTNFVTDIEKRLDLYNQRHAYLEP